MASSHLQFKFNRHRQMTETLPVLTSDYTTASRLIVTAASLSNDTTVDALPSVAKLGQSTVGRNIFTARCYAERGIAKASCPSVCNVEVSWSYRLEFLENNSTAN